MSRRNTDLRYSRHRRHPDDFYEGLSDLAQVIYFRILNRPDSPVPGLVALGRLGLAEHLGRPPRAVSRAVDELCKAGLLIESTKPRLLWIPEGLLADGPCNQGVTIGWARGLRSLGRCFVVERCAWQIYLAATRMLETDEANPERWNADRALGVLISELGWEPFPEPFPAQSQERLEELSREPSPELSPPPSLEPIPPSQLPITKYQSGSGGPPPEPGTPEPDTGPSPEPRLLRAAPAPEPDRDRAVLTFADAAEAFECIRTAKRGRQRVLESLDDRASRALEAIGGAEAIDRASDESALLVRFAEAYDTWVGPGPGASNRGSWRARAAPAATRVARAGPGRRRQLELGRGRW
jgi:hypothetical protein